jgi:iron complex transport system substrate-binding protein
LTNRADLERLTGPKPDLIIDFGAVNDNYRSLATRTQAETGIPVVLIDGSFINTPTALRQLGSILGVNERGEQLARAAEAIYAEVDRLRDAVTKRPRVYFAGGQDGLQTGGDGSNIGEIIERVGGINVGGGERRGDKFSPEQVAAWAPDAILTFNRGFRDAVATSSEWQRVPAIAAGRVFVSPELPFGFIHEPPSVNRLIGLTWLLHKLYPDQAPGNLREQVRAFYRVFYQVEPTDVEIGRELDGS